MKLIREPCFNHLLHGFLVIMVFRNNKKVIFEFEKHCFKKRFRCVSQEFDISHNISRSGNLVNLQQKLYIFRISADCLFSRILRPLRFLIISKISKDILRIVYTYIDRDIYRYNLEMMDVLLHSNVALKRRQDYLRCRFDSFYSVY